MEALWITTLLLQTSLMLMGFGLLIGSFFGGIFACLHTSKSKVIRILSRIPILIIKATPVFYFAAFLFVISNSYSNASLWAYAPIPFILAFGIYAGAFISEIFGDATKSISKNQIYAAKLLGLSNFQIFVHIKLPKMLKASFKELTTLLFNLMQFSAIIAYLVVDYFGGAKATFQETILGIAAYMVIGLLLYGVLYIVAAKNKEK